MFACNSFKTTIVAIEGWVGGGEEDFDIYYFTRPPGPQKKKNGERERPSPYQPHTTPTGLYAYKLCKLNVLRHCWSHTG